MTTMTTVLLMLTLSSHPPPDIVRDRVDIIELNHYFDGMGRPVFQQLIFWEWRPVSRRRGQMRVVAWRMVTDDWPLIWREGSRWRLLWHDQGILRDVRAREFRQSWTQFDPELVDRKLWPTQNRRELLHARP